MRKYRKPIMMELIKRVFGLESGTDYGKLLHEGAIVLDVRTAVEYAAGHIPGSMNIPLDQLRNSLNRLKDKNKPVVACCASGARSSTACGILKANGYREVHNGGDWRSLQGKIHSAV